MGISDQARNEIDEEVKGAAMARMLNLRNVLELVIDSFDDGTLTQEQFVGHEHQLVFHIGFEFGDELNALLHELFKQGL